MNKRILGFFGLLLLLFSVSAYSQEANHPLDATMHDVRYVTGAPTGTQCPDGKIIVDRVTGIGYVRVSGTCQAMTAGSVPTTRTISTTSPLTGGGNLSADRTFACPTCGVTGTGLNQFASTTSAQLLGVISNETGSGLVVGNDTPTILTPTIASFINATHNHQSAAGGGSLDAAALGSGTLAAGRMPALTGDVTSTVNTVATTVAKVNGSTPGGTCTNQFVRSLSSSAVPTCASVANTDLSNSSVTIGSTSVSLGSTAATVAGLTLTTPAIASFTNATHNHTNAAGGGQLSLSAFSSTTGSGAVVGGTSPNFTTGITLNSGTALTTYTENTCTLNLKFTGASTGMAYSVQVCKYTQIGDEVFVDAYVQLSAKGSSTGAATITGLPVAATSTANRFQGFVFGNSNMSYTGILQGYIDPSATTSITLQTNSGGTAVAAADTNFTNTSSLLLTFHYKTN